MRRILLIAIVLGLASAGAAYYYYGERRAGLPAYRFAKVVRGPFRINVSASGTLNAVNTIQVGSQVSGQIKELLVDYNSEVKKGQVIARIAPEIFEAKLDQAQAQLEAARAVVLTRQAGVEQAQADLDNAYAAQAAARAQTVKARVALLDSKRNYDRQKALYKEKLIPLSERDNAEAAFETAQAQYEATQAQERAQKSSAKAAASRLRVAEAQIKDAAAQVKQREAALRQSKADLDYTIIRSPVDGIVVSRNVDVGQTVAASLQAPTLFTIAEDLQQMQVNTLVDEADISQVRVDQRATFTVDSFPGQTFRGRVVQVRKAPQVAQNVVNYDVVISARNPELKLLPGMTANVAIVVESKGSAMKIPNAALRFNPAGAAIPAQPVSTNSAGGRGGGSARAPSIRELSEAIIQKLGLSDDQKAQLRSLLQEARLKFRALRGMARGDRAREAAKIRQSVLEGMRGLLKPEQKGPFKEILDAFSGQDGGFAGRVWVMGGEGKPELILVRVGRSDGNFTELLSGSLNEGQDVIVQAVRPGAARTTTGAPRGLRFGF